MCECYTVREAAAVLQLSESAVITFAERYLARWRNTPRCWEPPEALPNELAARRGREGEPLVLKSACHVRRPDL